MVRFQYNKTSLHQLNKQLLVRLKALPTLKNKESALRVEVKNSKSKFGELERDFEKRVSMEDVASELNISYVWFRTYFKKHAGFSPYDYLINIRINHDRLLLQNSGLSVKEISQSSGFESQQQFIKTFKKKTGLTPLQFRKQ